MNEKTKSFENMLKGDFFNEMIIRNLDDLRKYNLLLEQSRPPPTRYEKFKNFFMRKWWRMKNIYNFIQHGCDCD